MDSPCRSGRGHPGSTVVTDVLSPGTVVALGLCPEQGDGFFGLSRTGGEGCFLGCVGTCGLRSDLGPELPLPLCPLKPGASILRPGAALNATGAQHTFLRML